MVLVVQQDTHSATVDAALLRDQATIAFLVAFFGCVVAAFTFAVVAGEEELAPRSHAMALLGGGGLALSVLYVLWGLVSLVKLFLSPSILAPARLVFYGGTLVAPAFLVLSSLDPVLAFNKAGKKRTSRPPFPTRLFVSRMVLSYIPIGLSILAKWSLPVWLTPVLASGFNFVVFAALAMMGTGALWALVVSSAKSSYRIPPRLGGVLAFLNSCAFGILVVLLP